MYHWIHKKGESFDLANPHTDFTLVRDCWRPSSRMIYFYPCFFFIGARAALFIGKQGNRIGRNILYNLITKHATRLGLHNPDSNKLEDHFSPHCFRYWFTTNLRRNGMNREFIKELRGDSRGEAIDIYDHIDHEELRKAYLTAIPKLGIV